MSWRIRERHREQARRQRGVAMSEASICLSAFALLLHGALYFGEAYWQKQGVVTAARYISIRAMRSNDSTIKPGQHKALLQRSYPLTGRTSYATRNESYGIDAKLAAAQLARAGRSPISASSRAVAYQMGLSSQGGDRMVQHTVTATYTPAYLKQLKTLRLKGSLTVPNGSQWTLEDLGGEDALIAAELELARYERQRLK